MAVLSDPVTNFCVGNPLSLPRSAAECPAPVTNATLTIFPYKGATVPLVGPYGITSQLGAFGQITNTGVLQADLTYTAQLVFNLSALDTLRLPPGAYSWATIEVAPGPYVSEVVPLWPLEGGPHDG